MTTPHQKLASLANFLDDLPHRRFHMPKWVSEDHSDTHCGTAACACGWAATIFHKEGWTFGELSVRYGEQSGAEAFADFFHLSHDDAWLITTNFMNYCHRFGVMAERVTPHMAAEVIRDVLRRIDPDSLESPATVEVAHLVGGAS